MPTGGDSRAAALATVARTGGAAAVTAGRRTASRPAGAAGVRVVLEGSHRGALDIRVSGITADASVGTLTAHTTGGLTVRGAALPGLELTHAAVTAVTAGTAGSALAARGDGRVAATTDCASGVVDNEVAGAADAAGAAGAAGPADAAGGGAVSDGAVVGIGAGGAAGATGAAAVPVPPRPPVAVLSVTVPAPPPVLPAPPTPPVLPTPLPAPPTPPVALLSVTVLP